MEINVKNESITDHKTEALVLGLFEGGKLSPELKSIDDTLNNEISLILRNDEFKGEFGQCKLLHTLKKFPAQKIILAGLGKEKEFTTEKLRRVSAITAKCLRECGVKSFSTTLQTIPVGVKRADERTQIIVEGIVLGLYDFKRYVTIDKDKIKEIKSVTIVESKDNRVNDVKNGLKKGFTISNNVNYIRNLVNEPAEKVTPSYFAKEALHLGKISKGRIKVKVFSKKDIEKMGMGGILAVSKGSSQEPKFIILDYNSTKKDPIVFVGKGITFDSGGLNVKPWQGMETMKCDMAGAATVLSTVKTAWELNLGKRVVAVIPACENMSGSRAYKQGDILTSYNGKTIEISHTDAEGRLILSDALGYAEKIFRPKAIIDIATLTGASIIALGYEIVCLMSSDNNLKKKILDASNKTDEMTWELPLFEDYKELVKSDTADVRNTSKEPIGPGTITAGLFLNNFVENTPWAHLDIGASGWAISDKAYKKKGGTGVCLRTFIKLLEEW